MPKNLTPEQRLNEINEAVEILLQEAVILVRGSDALAHVGIIYAATFKPQVFGFGLIGAAETATGLLLQMALQDRVLADCLANAADESEEHYRALSSMN